jgi:hypothetical protein
VLGAGLEPACLSAYAPQTYVSAIPPPERFNRIPRKVFRKPRAVASLLSARIILLVLSMVITGEPRIEHEHEPEHEI